MKKLSNFYYRFTKNLMLRNIFKFNEEEKMKCTCPGIAKNFIRDIIKKESVKEYRYLFQSKLHNFVLNQIGIAMCTNKNLSFETLCDSLPKRLGSRSSILSVLSSGVEKKFLYKSVCKEDKRLRVYKMNSNFFELWEDHMQKLGRGYREVG